jgi:hypothetical protein
MALWSKGGQIQLGQHQDQKVLIGVGFAIGVDTGVFTQGKTDAVGYATAPTNAITDWICGPVEEDPAAEFGRVIYRAVFTRLHAGT